jgi:hypothetical protein
MTGNADRVVTETVEKQQGIAEHLLRLKSRSDMLRENQPTGPANKQGERKDLANRVLLRPQIHTSHANPLNGPHGSPHSTSSGIRPNPGKLLSQMTPVLEMSA